MPSITAKAIAQKLGLSTASVSVALNGKPGVSPATRERILAAAAELGYPASRAANADSKLLCFLIYVDQAVGIAQESTFYTFVLKGVETAAKELGYRILIRYYYASQNFDSQMSDIVGDLSGLLILGTDMTAARREEIGELIGQVSLPFPIVILDNFIFSAYVDCVGNDNLYGAKSAMSYLVHPPCGAEKRSFQAGSPENAAGLNGFPGPPRRAASPSPANERTIPQSGGTLIFHGPFRIAPIQPPPLIPKQRNGPASAAYPSSFKTRWPRINDHLHSFGSCGKLKLDMRGEKYAEILRD